MLIAETFHVAAPVEVVWRYITDPSEVAPCIPGCESIEITGPCTYTAVIKVSVGPISASFKMNVELTEEDPPWFAASVAKGEEGGRASTVSSTNELRLTEAEAGGTDVSYSAEVSVVGRLGRFGLGVMKKKAKSIGEAFATAFRARVEAAETGEGVIA